MGLYRVSFVHAFFWVNLAPLLAEAEDCRCGECGFFLTAFAVVFAADRQGDGDEGQVTACPGKTLRIDIHYGYRKNYLNPTQDQSQY